MGLAEASRNRLAFAVVQTSPGVFLPCALSTSGRIHRELLRLPTSLPTAAPRGTLPACGMTSLSARPSFTWRRSQFFWQHRSTMGLATAFAAARRAHLESRLCALPLATDPLLPQPPCSTPRSQESSHFALPSFGAALARCDPYDGI